MFWLPYSSYTSLHPSQTPCIYKYTREHNQQIMTTSITNEYTSLKDINLSHFIFEKVMFVVCEKWVETRTDCYIDPSSSLEHSGTSFTSWLGLLNQGSLSAQSPLSAAGSHFGILSPTDSNRPGTWLYYFLTSTCFRCSSAYLHVCISWLSWVNI